MFSFKEWYIKGTKFGSVKALEKILETVTTLFKFDGTAYTDANGERFLENVSGTQDIKLVSGRGLEFNGVDQHIGTNYVPDILSDFTILIPMYGDGSDQYPRHGCESALNMCRLVTYNGSDLLVNIGQSESGNIPLGVSDGERYELAVVGAGGVCSLYKDGLDLNASFSITGYNPTSDFQIACSNDDGTLENFMGGIIDYAYFIPKALTLSEIQAHYNNPEKTLYREAGVLKSDILPQATLDSMAAGNGFAYLMTENSSSSGYLTDITKTKADNLLTDPLTQIAASSAFTKLDAINGVYSINTTSYKDLRFGISGYTEQFIVVEWEIFDYAGGDFFINLDGGTSTVNSYAVSGNGFHRKVLYNTDNNRVDLSTHGYFNGSIRNIYVAPLNNSNIAAVENWSSTMHTNVADHSHGIQTALLKQDTFGVPTRLVSIDVEAKDFIEARTQFADENGLILTDNAGELELKVDPNYTYSMLTEDGQTIQTEDGQTLEV
jgi:hypothetical protein